MEEDPLKEIRTLLEQARSLEARAFKLAEGRKNKAYTLLNEAQGQKRK